MLAGAAPPDRRPRDGRGDGRPGRCSTASCPRRPPTPGRSLAAIADGRVDESLSTSPSSGSCGSSSGSGCSNGRTCRAVIRHDGQAGRRGAHVAADARPAVDRAARERRDPPAGGRIRGRIAVIGPIADSARDLIGDYGHLLHIETLRELRHRANPFGVPVDRRDPARPTSGPCADDPRRARARAWQGPTRSARRAAPGCATARTSTIARGGRRRREAPTSRSWSLGERSGLTYDATTGEFRDRRDLGFLGRQQELLEAVVATGHADRAARRQRPTAGARVGRRSTARPWSSPGCRASPDLRRSPTSSSVTRTQAASCRSRCPATSARSRSRTATTRPAAGRTGRSTYVDGADDAAVAVRARALVHDVRRSRTYASTGPRARPAGDEVDVSVDVTNTGHAAGRRGRPALRPRRGGDGRAPGHRAARVPTGPPRARRMPVGIVPAGDRAVRLHRRGLPAGRRAGPDHDLRRHLVGRPAALGGR